MTRGQRATSNPKKINVFNFLHGFKGKQLKVFFFFVALPNTYTTHTHMRINAFNAVILCLVLIVGAAAHISVAKETPDSDNDATCAELKADEGYKSSVNNGTISRSCSRPMSICSEPEKKWVEVVAGMYIQIYIHIYI